MIHETSEHQVSLPTVQAAAIQDLCLTIVLQKKVQMIKSCNSSMISQCTVYTEYMSMYTFPSCSIEHVVGSKVTVGDECAIVIYRNIALYRMSGFLLDMIIAQANYRDNIEIPVYCATLTVIISIQISTSALHSERGGIDKPKQAAFDTVA